MSPEDRKDLSREALGLWASDSAKRPEDLFPEDYVNHQESDVAGGVSTRGLSAYKTLLDGHHAAFGQSRVEILMQICEGDLVATRWSITVEHTGPFMGAPPTGKTVSWTGIQIDRSEDGRIVESWVDWDKYGFLEGLGLVKPAG